MAMVPAGRRDRRIRIEQKTTETLPDGTVRDTGWLLVRKMWAEIVPLRGREAIEAQAEQARFDTIIRTLWVEGITTDMRIVGPDRQVYDIVHIAPLGTRRGLDMQCNARQGDEV